MQELRNRGHFFHVYIASSKHEGVWENSRQLCKPSTTSRVAYRSRILPIPMFRWGYVNMKRKFSIAFIKYFSKLIRQMKGNFVYLLFDPKRFSQYML